MTSQPRIVSGRATLAADVVGSGDPVVFLHANICDRRMWRAQLDAIGAGNQAIAYDRRGFGETRAEQEEFSGVADLIAVIAAVADGRPAILVGCSQGGRIAIDAALRHPASVRGLVLISPTVTGAPEPVLPPAVRNLLAEQKAAEAAGDLDRVIAIKARLWLDGPLQPEGRVTGPARELFCNMNATALRAPPTGPDVDLVPDAFQRLGEIAVPSLVICGDMDFPHIQERSRHAAGMMPNGAHHVLAGAAHAASLDRSREVTDLIATFIH
ncbi:alpha/beta hydrolase [Ferrovibrio sp.]|uniref:alpha/beta fold hydrolase n=1 Tax=Ferrovibrio sp. TaxID=1917215 RepID=UPI00260835CA|nr:alpha/beta hydrolase [Ferrovibrio sp.]